MKRYHEHPTEGLYDVVPDPYEIQNLASDRAQSAMLQELREKVRAWMKEQGDEGKVFGQPRLLA